MNIPDRLDKPDPLIECEICGKMVPESETVNVFMDFKTPKDVCEKHYLEWMEEEIKKEVLDNIEQVLKSE